MMILMSDVYMEPILKNFKKRSLAYSVEFCRFLRGWPSRVLRGFENDVYKLLFSRTS